MKYSFLLGSNAFIVNQPVITYAEGDNMIELLRIKSVFTPATNNNNSTILVVDTNITDTHKHNIALADGDYNHPDYKTVRTDKQIHVTDSDGHIVIDVLQLDDDALNGLSSHVLNELNNVGETHVIRLRGDFMIGEHRITIDNEKFYVDDDIYAESVHVGQHGIQLSGDGVKI